MKIRKIGIPRALLYYYYYPFWQTLFTELGMKIVLSKPTDKSLLDQGVKYSTSEICVPMKVYIGHILELLKKDIDYIYIPRFISIKEDITFCPKFLGLPDMIKNSLSGTKNKILTHHIKAKSDDISDYKNYKVFIDKLGVKKKNLQLALKKAREEWHKFRRKQKDGQLIDQLSVNDNNKVNETHGDLTIGLLAYVYNLNERYVNMDFLNKLRGMGVNVVTFEMLKEKEINQGLQSFDKPMFWQFTNKLLGAGYHFINSNQIDGIIHLTAFGCGPDSILAPFLETDAEKENKPFLTLRIDEQTGSSHLITRIEAFIDLLRLKQRRKTG